MELSSEEKEILSGKHGKTLAKLLKILVDYGKVYGADKLVECKSSHFVLSCGLRMVNSLYMILSEMVEAGLRSKVPLTANPRPMDTSIYPFIEKLLGKIIYNKQRLLEDLLVKLGLISHDAFTCTPYYIGNKPGFGEFVAWAESSAVVYANSVLGARTNKNTAIIELISGILGKTPCFGMLLDENRKASWIIKVEAKTKPLPHVLGALIGKTILDEVPFITGLEKWEYEEHDLKDMGAAAAAWGGVSLFHVEDVTPEAREYGGKMIREDHRVLRITDHELDKMVKEMKAGEHVKPDIVVIGCPHLSLCQLREWARILSEDHVKYNVWLIAAPKIIEEFKKTKDYDRIKGSKVKLTSICPLMFTNIPTCKRLRILTNSAKLRYYSHASYVPDDELVKIVLDKGGRR